MSSDPAHLQTLSEKIYNEKDSFLCSDPCSAEECIYRTVINRSYYAAYNFFKNWAINDDKLAYNENMALKEYNRKAAEKNKNPIGIHKVFILFLLDNAKRHVNSYVIRYCANELENIRKDRNNADYRFDKDISNSTAKTNCLSSKKIIKNVKNLNVVEQKRYEN